MVLDIADFTVKAGSEDAFAAAAREGLPHVAATPGFLGASLTRGPLGRPVCAAPRVGIARSAHRGVPGLGPVGKWRALVGAYFDGDPRVEHATDVLAPEAHGPERRGPRRPSSCGPPVAARLRGGRARAAGDGHARGRGNPRARRGAAAGRSRRRADTSLYLPATTPAPAVLVAHGFGGTKASVDADARDLAARGFVVLTWTARGFGASGGQIAARRPGRGGRRRPQARRLAGPAPRGPAGRLPAIRAWASPAGLTAARCR